MTEALNRLSQLANEESFGEDIPDHFISKIDSHKEKLSKFTSAYQRIENFSKNKNFKIENQRRLKFLEELSELREKPSINRSFNANVSNTQNDSSLPLYLRAEQIVRDRNHSLNAKKSECSRKVLLEEIKQSSKFSNGKGKHNPDFFENLRRWQTKKERNIKSQKEKKEEEEIKELKSSPQLNEKSMKIVSKLRELQNSTAFTLNRLAMVNKKHSLSPSPTFVPSITERTKTLASNRSGSVFERLYTVKSPRTAEKPRKVIVKESQSRPMSTSLFRSYSINSSKGIICDKHRLVDQVNYQEKMNFLLESLL